MLSFEIKFKKIDSKYIATYIPQTEDAENVTFTIQEFIEDYKKPEDEPYIKNVSNKIKEKTDIKVELRTELNAEKDLVLHVIFHTPNIETKLWKEVDKIINVHLLKRTKTFNDKIDARTEIKRKQQMQDSLPSFLSIDRAPPIEKAGYSSTNVDTSGSNSVIFDFIKERSYTSWNTDKYVCLLELTCNFKFTKKHLNEFVSLNKNAFKDLENKIQTKIKMKPVHISKLIIGLGKTEGKHNISIQHGFTLLPERGRGEPPKIGPLLKKECLDIFSNFNPNVVKKVSSKPNTVTPNKPSTMAQLLKGIKDKGYKVVKNPSGSITITKIKK
jgi:hypothetical protein